MNPDLSADTELDTSDFARRLDRGDLPVVTPPDPIAPGDTCHFVTPVRFGRRRSDQYGHLVLTGGWMKFRGTLDLSVTWSEVGQVHRVGREVVIGLEDSRRLLRFSCHSEAEATRGALLAKHLTRSARLFTADPSTLLNHATL